MLRPEISLAIRRCAVIGSPIAHSLSPAMHRAAYAELGLDWEYGVVEVPRGGVAALIEGLDVSWRGLSVTMPNKPELLDLPGATIDPAARLAGGGNTVILDAPADRRTVTVYNTDIAGLARAVRRCAPGLAPRTALLLGSGATARSALLGLADLGVSRVLVAARAPEKAAALGELAARAGVGLEIADWSAAAPPTDLVVSALPGGALTEAVAARFATAPVVFDLAYDPWPSTLAAVAAERGAQVLDGLELLADQAVLQLELMIGRGVPAATLVTAGRAELRRRAAP